MTKKMFLKSILFVGLLIYLLSNTNGVDAQTFDYKAALTKSLLYFEGQRSGKLPPNQRVNWRDDSGLDDGKDANLDLSGGYYDSGDNVKFGFPMAFTITMLAWSVVDFTPQLNATNELTNAIEAIKWGTDFLKNANPDSTTLYGQVGDGDSDHDCWERPEDMTTPRTAYKIDKDHPGSELAAETAAAFAAASIVFSRMPEYFDYSIDLINRASALFTFAQHFKGVYHDSIPGARKFYPSGGYDDEFLWAAAWIYRATLEPEILDFLKYVKDMDGGGTRTRFSWDDKYVGAQLLITKLLYEGEVENEYPWTKYESCGFGFFCNVLDNKTPAGLKWFQSWNNLQYTTASAFLATFFGDVLAAHDGRVIHCSNGRTIEHPELTSFAQSQVDYILGANPKNMSYMVGYGSNYPKRIKHRGASIVSIKNDPTPVTCKGGFDLWFNKNESDPNLLEGAIVGGPDKNDEYTDSRSNHQQAEPSTFTVAPIVGVLARFAAA